MFKYAVDKGWLTAIPDMVVPDIHKLRIEIVDQTHGGVGQRGTTVGKLWQK